MHIASLARGGLQINYGRWARNSLVAQIYRAHVVAYANCATVARRSSDSQFGHCVARTPDATMAEVVPAPVSGVCVRRLRVIPFVPGDGLLPAVELGLLSELCALGVRVTNAELLCLASPSVVHDHVSRIIDPIRELRGGHVSYVPLFDGFPEHIPDDHEYFARRIIGYVLQHMPEARDGRELSNGIIVPTWLFNLERFGADPITQLQTPELKRLAEERHKRREQDTHIEWMDFELIPSLELHDRLTQWVRDCMYSKAPIKHALRNDVQVVLQHIGSDSIVFENIPMKETQSLYVSLLWTLRDESKAADLLKTPTDILRLFASLTDTDVSLAKRIRFPKLSRGQRRLVLQVLDQSSTLHDDLQQYRRLWLEIGRYIHPGEFREKFPRVATAFDQLRNAKLCTYRSVTEELIQEQQPQQIVHHLVSRPGIFGRKLHELLRRFPNHTDMIVNEFSNVVMELPLKNLLVMQRYFNVINNEVDRSIVNKSGRMRVVPNNSRGALTTSTIEKVCEMLDVAVSTCIACRFELWTGKNVWIDERLQNITVPLQQRAASDACITLGRGSSVDLDTDLVLRLFVYWHECGGSTTDIDLSVIQFDEDFLYKGHVSYTNLEDDGVVHSGDIQSAPNGAAEFIDISLHRLRSEVRYLGVQVHKYCGAGFANIECIAGWMFRKNTSREYKSFDIRTVSNKFPVNRNAKYCIPIVVDVVGKRATLCDLYVGGVHGESDVEGSYEETSELVREIHRFVETRPRMDLLAHAHAKARGAKVVCDRECADITFGLEHCTFNCSDVERINAELL